MAKMKTVRAEMFVNVYPTGRDVYAFRARITQGPEHMLDRHVTIQITGEEFDRMRQIIDGNRDAIKRTEEMVKRINEGNAAFEEG